MLKIILVILMLSNYSCYSTKQNNKIMQDSILEIDFQDFFVDDTVTLNINGCLIFKDELLTSDKSDGFTNLSVKVYKINESKLLIRYFDKATECKNNTNKFSITILLNDNLNSYNIDMGEGKHLGFSKRNTNELYFKQSKIPFIYD